MGLVAQVAHPTSLRWTATQALETLVRAASKLPESVELLIAGAGFISLAYGGKQESKSQMRQAEFLARLHDWTHATITNLLLSVPASNRELVFGIDVDVQGVRSGQFMAWVGRSGLVLIPKRYPSGAEDRFLAGVDAAHSSSYSRILDTNVGPTLMLVCHDAQVFNHRNQANVKRAKRVTARTRAAGELQRRVNRRITWGLNAVHEIKSQPNTLTFRNSYRQLRDDLQPDIRVCAGTGYDQKSVQPHAVPALLDRMTAPPALSLPKIIIFA
ncbi:MAG: hypothetical protein H0V54_12780 [Chthoniobacterales bacterium]|nr:hypothetical protein [Chthoniobacterales bacterium]